MANFDVAVGLTQSGLNSTLASLFGNSTAQSKIFTQSFSQTVSGIPVDITLKIDSAPTIALSPPSTTYWQQSYNAQGQNQTGNPPSGNVFQLLISSLSVSGTVSGVAVSGSTSFQVYAQVSLSNNKLSFDALSVWLDESTWNKMGLTTLIVNAIIIPYGLNTANNLLSAISIPQIPSFLGVSFQDPILGITNANELVVATSMTTSSATSLDSYTPPTGLDIFMQADLDVTNAVLAGAIKNYPFDESTKSGGSAAYASAEIKGTVQSVTASISSGTTNANISIANISGYGELGGTATAIAKTVLCPIGTAIDAISNPSDWDKIVSSFSITYSPNPLPVPFTLNVNADGDVLLSIGQLSTVTLIFSPQWSGVIGSALAAAAAGFADLVTSIFKEKVVNPFISKFAQNINIWSNPSVSTQVEGITITISANTGTALATQGDNYIVEGFTVSFS
ncbi:hypothetical protein F0919_14350 [Taibaiella lutea]|uniref:TULIP family P47-like protein n=1 Tax=Taibaiella lutea TaxID=2608001 RepID=A0A5M6CH08_9BACT|nr:hypothetical protein [Taibaiella lutea]KAA5533710.1 hypothetical protein F0919_14350 [Taibaiella lutea]